VIKNRTRKLVVTGLCVACIGASFLTACGSNSGDSSASSGTATSDAQPGSAPPSGNPGAPPAGSSSGAVRPTAAAYVQNGSAKAATGQTYTAAQQDQSGLLVTDGGTLTLTNATVNTSGETSSNDSSSFYGLNAAVVALTNSTINMTGGSITTSGSGANGAFAVGTGSSVSLSDLTITANGGGGHGVMATQGGSVTLNNVVINTAGKNSAPLATDRGGGTITATGGSATCSGADSPALYSTGTIIVNGGTYKSLGAEAAVIEGGNTINLTDVDLSSSMADKWGVMIYQSMSGDAEGTQGTFTMERGSLALTASNGPLFYVTNSIGNINLSGVDVVVGSGMLVKAAAGNWGSAGSNGGHAVLTADGQTLSGNLVADSISSLVLTLANGSSLTGAINNDKAAGEVRVTLDSNSTWNVTADSYLTSLTLSGGVSGTTISNIKGAGHTVYYDASDSANSALGGKTQNLSGGGQLRPAS
jgi:hypothetical protein